MNNRHLGYHLCGEDGDIYYIPGVLTLAPLHLPSLAMLVRQCEGAMVGEAENNDGRRHVGTVCMTKDVIP
jgi:hypothetical protein